jgi:ATP-dependent helicase/DNAse subunit B
MDCFHADAGSMLVVPSATQAEHARHELARAGVALRPGRVTTLAGFLDERAPPAPSSFLLHFAIEDALARVRPARFAGVAEYRGFRVSLARLLEEVPAEGFDGGLAAVFREVERVLEERGFALRHRRIEQVAQAPGHLPPHLVLDGFFSFSRAELNLLIALASRTKLTVTLPDWPSAGRARRELLSSGFREHPCREVHRRATMRTFAAPTLEREVEEIARRVLQEARLGRGFREMGVILRVRDPYGPALETVFARFGIPARFYFADPLIAHPAIAFLAAVMRALLGGWNYEDLLALAQMPASGLDQRFDFDLRAHLPGAGLLLNWLDQPPPLLEKLGVLDSWRRHRLQPRDWGDRLKTLRTLVTEPEIGDDLSRQQLRAWQSTAVALEAFDQAVSDVAGSGNEAVLLVDFWKGVETALAVETLRVPDRRSNVVHVFDVYEARQWELPLVFVCGLVEGHFPQYHREDPIVGDAARRRAGLRTSAELEEEEPVLFALAAARATEKIIFSYARFNEKGDDAVPSFFLDLNSLNLNGVEFCDTRVHPRPVRQGATAVAGSIGDAALLAQLAKTHQALAPTSIESFLQCPFQFFAAKTLRLRPRPKTPRERLDVLLQGTILHRALAEVSRAPLLGAAIFDDVFEEECRHARVPANYRTEAVRLEMRRHFDAFLGDAQVVLGWASRVEEKFSFALNPLLTLRGRIDRLDVGPGRETLVIDYKYSAANRIRERTDEDQAGNLVQGGLYLLAAERQFGLKPIGMLYCGLRKGVVWDGWHLPIPGLEKTGEVVTREQLRAMTHAAAGKAVDVFEAITSGTIAARPADEKKCAWCDFSDICRVESPGAKKAAPA